MKTKTTRLNFCNESPLNAAVIRQMGGWTAFKESAGDIIDHGIDGGFHGFIYHTETNAFARRHMREIRNALGQDADAMGGSLLEMVAAFRCLNGDYSQDEIAEVIWGNRTDDQILNALAWYAAEVVARRYCDEVAA